MMIPVWNNKQLSKLSNEQIVGKLISAAIKHCEFDNESEVTSLEVELKRRLNSKCVRYKKQMKKVREDLPEILCSQSYWTADELCDVFENFLDEISKDK